MRPYVIPVRNPGRSTVRSLDLARVDATKEPSPMRVHVVTVPSRRRESIVASLRDLPPVADQPLENWRSLVDDTSSHHLDELGVVREAAEIDGVDCEWLQVPDRRRDAVVVFLHGGGFVAHSVASHRDRSGRIALAAGCDGLVVSYRLAPEHPFPAALDDAVAVCRAVQRSGRPLLLVGDGAGAGLAVSAMVALRDAGDPLPLGAVCISPWVDLTLTAGSLRSRLAADPFAHLHDLRSWAAAYLDGADPSDPSVSPLFADLTGLPPLLVQVGSDEILFDDALALAERASAARVPTVLEEWMDMFHTWHAYAGALEAADGAIDHAGTFLGRLAPHLAGQETSTGS